VPDEHESGNANGVTTEELGGLITHLAFYAGWPCAVNAQRVLVEGLEEAD